MSGCVAAAAFAVPLALAGLAAAGWIGTAAAPLAVATAGDCAWNSSATAPVEAAKPSRELATMRFVERAMP